MEGSCPIEYTLSLISGKWKILILKEISKGPLRYGELTKSIPAASSKMLIQHLRQLEDDGLIIRTVFPEVPPRVEYALSGKGRSIFEIFIALRSWGLASGGPTECKFCKKCMPYIEE